MVSYPRVCTLGRAVLVLTELGDVAMVGPLGCGGLVLVRCLCLFMSDRGERRAYECGCQGPRDWAAKKCTSGESNCESQALQKGSVTLNQYTTRAFLTILGGAI